MTVRCFVFSFALIKALDCLVESEAQPSHIFLSNSTPPDSSSCSNGCCHSNASSKDRLSLLSYIRGDGLALWACLLLAPLIHWLSSRQLFSQSPSASSQLPTFLSVMTLFLSLMSGMVAANISINLSSIALSWGTFSTWYTTCLDDYPIATKSLTSGVFSWVADTVAQWFEDTNSRKSFRETYDKRRGFALYIDGIVLSGPLLHYAFGLMEECFPTDEEDGSFVASLIHVFITDYFIDSIYLALSFALVALLEGHASDLGRIYKCDFWTTIKASWCASFSLVPIEFICFQYLSVGYRVLGMNMIDIIWQAVVSFFAHRSRRENEERVAEPTIKPSLPTAVDG